jgi:hypothetical protein
VTLRIGAIRLALTAALAVIVSVAVLKGHKQARYTGNGSIEDADSFACR